MRRSTRSDDGKNTQASSIEWKRKKKKRKKKVKNLRIFQALTRSVVIVCWTPTRARNATFKLIRWPSAFAFVLMTTTTTTCLRILICCWDRITLSISYFFFFHCFSTPFRHVVQRLLWRYFILSHKHSFLLSCTKFQNVHSFHHPDWAVWLSTCSIWCGREQKTLSRRTESLLFMLHYWLKWNLNNDLLASAVTGSCRMCRHIEEVSLSLSLSDWTIQ